MINAIAIKVPKVYGINDANPPPRECPTSIKFEPYRALYFWVSITRAIMLIRNKAVFLIQIGFEISVCFPQKFIFHLCSGKRESQSNCHLPVSKQLPKNLDLRLSFNNQKNQRRENKLQIKFNYIECENCRRRNLSFFAVGNRI